MSRKTPNERLGELLSLAARAGRMRKAIFSKPTDPTILRTVVTPRRLGERVVAQAETLRTDHKAVHENISPEDTARFCALAEGFLQVNLLTTVGECELRRSKSGTCTLKGGDRLYAALAAEEAPAAQILENNRRKAYILKGDEPFLRLLDVSDANGRVRDKKQSKFRQINRFLEMVRDCLPSLPEQGTLRICDLCCGKSYLSFAVYHYFTNILGRSVRMTGVDLKPDVVESCSRVARELHFDGLEFLCGDVLQYDAGEKVHLVVSLHACDAATDFVLGKAAEWGTDVILSTPCCHHELNHLIDCPTLGFITGHSMLRQKLCDAATDAVRLKHLEALGYAVCALELIDPDETPKNVLLRALRKKDFDADSPDAGRLWEEYRQIKRFLLGDAADRVHF